MDRHKNTYPGKTRTRVLLRLSCFLPLALLCAPAPGTGQSAGVNQGGPGYLHTSPEAPQAGGSSEAARIEQMRLADRHRRVVENVAKMLQLSGELKSEIDQKADTQLSLVALKKAGEIEKLAREVKDSMKY